MAKQINITVPQYGHISPFELHRAIENKMEYLKGMSNPIPKVVNPKVKVKIKESAGLWNFIQGCLP